MPDVGEVRYKAKVDTGSVDKDIKNVEKIISSGADTAVNGFKKVGSAVSSVSIAAIKGIGTAFIGMSTAAATGVAALTKVAIENFAEYEQLVGGVETLFKESADVVEGYADHAYKTAGISANEYMSTVTSFSASLLQSLGGDTKEAAEYANRAVIDMADNANKMGTDMASIQNAYQGFAKQNYTMLDNLKLGYGGTQEEMKRLIQDASQMTDIQEKLGITVDSSSLSFGNIVNAISVMQESMGIAGTTALEASTTIEGSVNSMKAAWTNLTVGIADENADIDALLEQFVDSVGVAAGNILPRVQTILTGIASLMDGLPPIVAQGLETVLGQAPAFVQTALSLVSSFLNAIKESAPQIIESGIEAVMTLANGLLEMAPELMETAGDLVANLIDGISNHFPEILDTAISLIAAFVSGLGKAYPKIITSLGNLAASMVSAILSTNWFQVGKDIIGGIINGVGAMGGALVSAAKNVAKSALDGIKSFFGIASPSKVMRDQVGKQLDAGIGEGIEDNAALALDPAKMVSKSLSTSFALDINYNMPNTSGLLKDVTAGFQFGGTAQTQIEVPVILDGREIARASAWYMGEQLAWEERR